MGHSRGSLRIFIRTFRWTTPIRDYLWVCPKKALNKLWKCPRHSVGGHRGWAPGAIMVSLGGPVQSFVKFDILGSFLGLAAHRVRTKEFFFIEKGTLMSGANRGTSGPGASEGVKRLAKVDWLG